VRSCLATDPSYADSLSLGYEDDDGIGGVIAEGPALAMRARAAERGDMKAVPPEAPRSTRQH
jgi:hypothetical protein